MKEIQPGNQLALREIEKGGTNLWLLTVSCLLLRYVHVFLLIIFYLHCYFYSVPYFLYLLISALLDFSGYLPLSRGASAILGIFSHVMMGHLLSMLQISFNDYANISDYVKVSLKTMFKIKSLMFSIFCRLLSDIASC